MHKIFFLSKYTRKRHNKICMCLYILCNINVYYIIVFILTFYMHSKTVGDC